LLNHASTAQERSPVEVTMIDDQTMDAELDLARLGAPPDGRVDEFCRRVTDAMIEACHERFGIPTGDPRDVAASWPR
jgi:hypothetical protein